MKSFNDYILTKKAMATIKEYGMLDSISSIAVGFSGGYDSVALLHFLNELLKTKKIKLYAIHVNHGIRGNNADRDESFCIDFCKSLNIELYRYHINVPEIAEIEKKGIEETARDCRYNCFKECLLINKIDRIAVAHNSNDNLETVILNLARGSSLTGLSGITPSRDFLIRPFIDCSREDITEYVDGNNLPHTEDETNNDINIKRNFVRHSIYPLMCSLNPNVLEHVSSTSKQAKADDDYLYSLASNYVAERKVDILKALPDPVLRRSIELKYKSLSNGKPLSSNGISSTIDLLKGISSSVSLENSIRAVIKKEELYFENDCRTKEKISYNYTLDNFENYITEDDSYLIVSNSLDEIKNVIKEKQIIYNLFIYKSIDFDKIKSRKLYASSRNYGDTIFYGGLTRKVKKLFSDKKIPESKRKTIPLIHSGEDIIWIPGFPVCDIVKPKDNCENPLYICYLAKN